MDAPRPEQEGHRTPARLKRALTWVFLLVVVGTSAEVFARVDDAITWGAPLLAPYTYDELLLQDSLGFRGRPNFRYQKWRMNDHGFRGGDVDLRPRPGVIRVAVVGASETFGLYESEGGEYPARLQSALDSLAPGRYVVVNAALPGMSLLTMSSYYERVLQPLDLDLILAYPSPSFYLEPTPIPREYTPPRARPSDTVRVAGLRFDRRSLRSRFVGKLREVLRELIPAFVVAEVREHRLGRIRSDHPPAWTWREVPAERTMLMRAHFEDLIEAVRDGRGRLALVTHTNRFAGAPQDTVGPARRHLTNLAALYYPQATPYVLMSVDSIANSLMRELGDIHDVPIIEVEDRIPPDDEHFADYAHFTDVGAQAMADLLAQSIVDLFNQPPDTGEDTTSRNGVRDGPPRRDARDDRNSR